MNTKKVLVAGATGYLGRYVLKELKKQGYWVRALARSSDKLEKLGKYFDEEFIGEVTVPESIKDACDDIDVVFSSIGITKQKDKLTFKDVDYQGNKNLLNVAKKADIKKFIYVSVFNGPNLLHLDIVRAHEDFAADLKASGLDYAIIRPTGYFSDMGEFLKMAEKGRVWLIGKGERHGFCPTDFLARRQTRLVSHKTSGQKKRIRQAHLIVDFEGTLKVEDPDQFVAAIRSGIGPAKAYGCGLMSVAKA